MPFLRGRPVDWEVVQTARADFIVNAIREVLPAGSLWHEKTFALAQLESLVIVSTGGLYTVETFDVTSRDFADSQSVTIVGDLGIRVTHIPYTHDTLNAQDIQRIIQEARSEFDKILAHDRESIQCSFHRVTCAMDFYSPTDDVEQFGKVLFDRVAEVLGYPLTYAPYVARDLWLPASDFYNMKPYPEEARSAAEFVFDQPLPVEVVTRCIQSAVNSTASLRVPGIHGTIPGIRNLHGLHFVGRRF